MRPERDFELFCLAAQPAFNAGSADVLQRGMGRGANWDLLLAGARRHRIGGLLLAGLQRCPISGPPDAFIASLRCEAIAAARRSLAQMQELARLAAIFADSQIRVIALKGVALSAQLFGDPALRDPRDIDLLIDPAQFAEAEVRLIEAGYRHDLPPLSRRQAAAYRRWIKDAAYVNDTTGIRVELHRRLTDNPFLLQAEFASLWREREEVPVAGAAIAVLPPRLLPLYLCAHGAGHCWEELRWLVDLAAAVREPGAPERAAVAADAIGLGPAMLHALLLAHDWLGLPLGADLCSRARRDRRVALLHRILDHFYHGEEWHRVPAHGSFAGLWRYSLWLRCYNYALKADWRYWRYQAMREFLIPADWAAIRLPDRLFWLFPLLRPIGWLVRRWRS